MIDLVPEQRLTVRQTAFFGLVSGLAVALVTGMVVAIASVPHIQSAVHGAAGVVIGSIMIGTVTGPVGGLMARRWNVSPFIGGVMLTAAVLACVVGYLVLAYGAGDWPG